MKVRELIKELEKLPQDASVFHLWDGEPRTCINIVYESKNGNVITSDYDESCYSRSARPKDAHDELYWNTKKNPNQWKLEDDWDYIFTY